MSCDATSTSDLCTLLTSHPVVVRKEGQDLEGVEEGLEEKNLAAAVME